jgi:hypothetical protein
MEPEVVLLIVGIVVVAGGIAYLVHRQEKKRSEELRDLAEMSGMLFAERDDALLRDTLSGFEILKKGSGQKARNVFRMELDEGEVVLFGFEYRVDKAVHRQTTVAVRVPGRALPRFRMTPEGFFSRIGEALGMQDIDFASSPAFSSAYRLTGDDETAVRNLFRSDILAFFGTEPGWSVEGYGEWVVAYRHGERLDPEKLVGFAEKGLWISGLFAWA